MTHKAIATTVLILKNGILLLNNVSAQTTSSISGKMDHATNVLKTKNTSMNKSAMSVLKKLDSDTKIDAMLAPKKPDTSITRNATNALSTLLTSTITLATFVPKIRNISMMVPAMNVPKASTGTKTSATLAKKDFSTMNKAAILANKANINMIIPATFVLRKLLTSTIISATNVPNMNFSTNANAINARKESSIMTILVIFVLKESSILEVNAPIVLKVSSIMTNNAILAPKVSSSMIRFAINVRKD